MFTFLLMACFFLCVFGCFLIVIFRARTAFEEVNDSMSRLRVYITRVSRDLAYMRDDVEKLKKASAKKRKPAVRKRKTKAVKEKRVTKD